MARRNCASGSRRRRQELERGIYRSLARGCTVVYSKEFKAHTVVVGFVSLLTWRGKEYTRKLHIEYPMEHEYANLLVGKKVPYRIRRVEVYKDIQDWHKPTNKVRLKSRIYYYYELSNLSDKKVRTWRWARGNEFDLVKSSDIVTVSELKQKKR